MTVQVKQGNISIAGVTAPFLLAGRPGAAFLTIENDGEADRLVSATSTLSPKVELHTHIQEDGVMKMRPVEFIEIPAKETVELKSGGYHIMLFDVKDLPAKGSKIPLTLTFEKAGNVQIEAIVGEADQTHTGH